MHYLHHSGLLNNGLGLINAAGFPWLHHMPSLATAIMETKVCTSEVDVIPAPFCLAQQWVRIGKHCWVEQGRAVLKYDVGCNHTVGQKGPIGITWL
jgi:hypothetical protein